MAELTESTARTPIWDNAKGILVVLVVLGHAIQPAAASGVAFADVLYRSIYLFHMPAFVLVTGILTAELTQRRAGRLVTNIAVPYLLFQVFQTIEVSILRGSFAPLHVLVPRWTLWYLVAVILWRLSTPLWLALGPWVAVCSALALALLAGLGTGVGHALALDDALGFLPFFVIGLLARTRHTDLVRRRTVRVGALAIIIAAVLAVIATRHAFARSALQLGFATDALHTSAARGTLLRAALITAALVLTVAVLLLVPRRVTRWGVIGRASLYVYLLHPLVLLPFRHGSWATDTTRAVLVALGAVALAALLATPPARAMTRWAVEPVWAGRLLSARRV